MKLLTNVISDGICPWCDIGKRRLEQAIAAVDVQISVRWSMESIELTDGGLLLCNDSFLSSELAECCFTDLRDNCQWEQKSGIFGYMQPGLIDSYGDTGVSYRYLGVD